MNDNILKVSFGGNREITANPLWQYDYGQTLVIRGLNLPDLYEVHFGQSKTGNAVTVIGTEDGVSIPDSYLETAGEFYAWIYLHTGDSDGETEYQIKIPVKERAKPTHEEPTPVQQTEIERLIALAEEIVEHGGGSGGGSDGFSPIVNITTITGGHRISIQDKTHTATFDVMDGTNGTNGTNGTDGTDGTDGVSPTVTIAEITGGHRVTITDAEHPSGMQFDVMDGANGRDGTNGTNGSDGVSPVVSISAITGGNAVTITDATHPSGQTFNVMNGTNGNDYVLTAQDKSDIAALVNVSTPRIAKTSSDTVVELEPNKLYVFPEMSALTITLATPSDATIANEYHFIFTSGTTATTLTIPQTVNEPSGFTVEANTTYEVSIMENCMLVNSWAVSS